MPEGTLAGLVSRSHGYRVWLGEVEPVLGVLRRMGGAPGVARRARELCAQLEAERSAATSRRLARKSLLLRPSPDAAELFELAILAVRQSTVPASGGALVPGPSYDPGA